MKVVLVSSALLATSVAAFSSSAQSSRSTTVSLAANQAYKEALGVQPPLGLFDPFGMLDDVPQEGFDTLRYIELKHGRVAMLAVTGYLVTAAGIRFPGCDSIPDGIKAFTYISNQEWGPNVLAQMLATFAALEIVNRDATGENEFVGDFRNGYIDFGWDSFSDATKTKKRSIELNQGRAAMMGILGLVTHEAMGVSILPGGYLPGQ